MRLNLLLICLLPLQMTYAQTERGTSTEIKPWYEDWSVKPTLGLQTWATYTLGHQDFQPEGGRYVEADNRLNFMVRRLRFGTTAKVGNRLTLKFLGAADFIGADQRAGTVGGVNNGGFPKAQIWDAYAQYRIIPDMEALFVVAGYLRPPVGRESISGALGVSSFEKMWTQWYLRQHLVGTGPGGTGGAYLGGQSAVTDRLMIEYRAGLFNPQSNDISSGARTTPLGVARLNVVIGDPERETWNHILPPANSFGKRRTLAFAVNYASEGGTSAAAEGTELWGADWLISYRHFNFEGEYYNFVRTASSSSEYESSTYGLRMSYAIPMPNKNPAAPARFLEPTFMYHTFLGTTDLIEYSDAVATNFYGGTEEVYDLGLNYHLSPGKINLGIHYVHRDGDRGNLPNNGLLAWQHRQPGLGGIIRGDYVGFEVRLTY